MTYLEQYHELIKNGEVVVGYWIKKQIQNLIDDLDNPDYTYDTTAAHKRINFMQTCALQGKAPYYGKPIELMPFQLAFWEVVYSFRMADTGKLRFTEALLEIARKNGKALSLDTRIPTPDGDKTISDIKEGDYVFGANGEPVKVLAVSEIFTDHKCYEVMFEDGEVIIADENHSWYASSKKNLEKDERIFKLINNKKKYKYKTNYKEYKTSEIAKDYVRKYGALNQFTYRVPMAKAVQYSKKELLVDPYILGVWLGDGSHDKSNIATSEGDLKTLCENIKKRGYKYHVNKYGDSNIVTIDGLISDIKKLGLYKNKRIPEIYLHSSIEQRLELLKGFMDTDGCCSKSGECEFVQKRKYLVNDFSKLLTGLGIKHNIKPRFVELNGKKFISYRINFYVDKEHTCFGYPRKTERLKTILSNKMNAKSIVSVKEVESVPTKCLCVEGGLFLCGNKNTVTHNSTMLAGDGLYDLFCGAGGNDIVCASNSDIQAKLIWEEIAGMRQRLDAKCAMTRKNLTKLSNFLKNITIFRLSSKTQNKDGFNCSKGYLDESHDINEENGSSEIAEAIWRSMSTRDEPLFINCTTQGFSRSGCYLDKKIDYAKKVIEGEIDDPHFLAFLFEQDCEEEIWQDETSWEKSNPAIRYGVKNIDKLRRDVEIAKTDKSTRAHLLTKDFNIKQNSSQGWLAIENYTYVQEVKELENFRNCYCLAALDCSQTTDLTNLKLLFMKPNDPTKYVFSHYWIPETKLEKGNNDRSGGAQYEEWVQKGYMTKCKGAIIDLTLVADYIYKLKKQYGITVLKCGYDKAYAREFEKAIDDIQEGMREVINQKALSTPMKWCERDLISNTINFGNNPVDTWCLGNACYQVDGLGNYHCVKSQADKRIDGAVVLIILYATLMRFNTEFQKYIK